MSDVPEEQNHSSLGNIYTYIPLTIGGYGTLSDLLKALAYEKNPSPQKIPTLPSHKLSHKLLFYRPNWGQLELQKGQMLEDRHP
jgi:hypothetical protein